MDTKLTVEKYSASHKHLWDTFVKQAKNATFLFERDFMEYHSDRFKDFSLLVFNKGKLISVLPANIVENEVFSHQGLTYGGFVLSPKTKFTEVLNSYKAVLVFLSSEGITKLHLKPIPKIYCSQPSDEIDYLLFLTEAQQTRVDLSSTIDLGNPLKIQSNRTEGVKKAIKQNLIISEVTEFHSFWEEILVPNLKKQHAAKPVHSVAEITQLARSFPKNIKQYNVYQGETIVAGATIFETEHLAHVQYISANANKQQLGSLDFLFHHLITEKYANKRYFDFGVSNENAGRNVNKGLLYWKECFGARSIAQSFYTVQTAHHSQLDSVFI